MSRDAILPQRVRASDAESSECRRAVAVGPMAGQREVAAWARQGPTRRPTRSGQVALWKLRPGWAGGGCEASGTGVSESFSLARSALTMRGGARRDCRPAATGGTREVLGEGTLRVEQSISSGHVAGGLSPPRTWLSYATQGCEACHGADPNRVCSRRPVEFPQVIPRGRDLRRSRSGLLPEGQQRDPHRAGCCPKLLLVDEYRVAADPPGRRHMDHVSGAETAEKSGAATRSAGSTSTRVSADSSASTAPAATSSGRRLAAQCNSV